MDGDNEGCLDLGALVAPGGFVDFGAFVPSGAFIAPGAFVDFALSGAFTDFNKRLGVLLTRAAVLVFFRAFVPLRGIPSGGAAHTGKACSPTVVKSRYETNKDLTFLQRFMVEECCFL